MSMSLLSLPDDIIEDIYVHLDKKSMVSLKYSCRFFDVLSTDHLLKALYFYDEKSQQLPVDGAAFAFKVTMIPLRRLDAFLKFVAHHPNSLDLVESITISLHSFTGVYIDFLEMLAAHKERFQGQFKMKVTFVLSPSAARKNANLDGFSYVRFLINSYRGKVLPLVETPVLTLYENDEILEDASMLMKNANSDRPNLFPNSQSFIQDFKSIQIFSHDDLDMIDQYDLRSEMIELKLKDDHTQQPIKSSVVKNWCQNLTCLMVLTRASLDCLSEGVLQYLNSLDSNDDKIDAVVHDEESRRADPSLFPNLKTLAVSLCDTDFERNSFLLNSFSLGKITELEIQYQKSGSNDPNLNSNNVTLVKLLNTKVSQNMIEKLSITNLNKYNMLTNNIHGEEIFNDWNLCYSLINHLHIFNNPAKTSNLRSLTICLNTFITVVTPVLSGVDSYKTFVVTERYLQRKKELFDKILDLKSLTTLVIPDFLFNWFPFLPDSLHFNGSQDIGYGGRLSTHEIHIVKNLYSRFQGFENRSNLDIMDYPMATDHDYMTMNSYFDKLAPTFVAIAQQLPNLTLLNLGGLAVTVHRCNRHSSTVEKLVGVYDSWVFTNCPIEN